METSKIRREGKHAVTPSSGTKASGQFFSPLAVPKRLKKKKTAGLSELSRKPLKFLNDLHIQLPGSKSSTPKHSRVSKSTNHRRILSTGEAQSLVSSSKHPLPYRRASFNTPAVTPAVCKYSFLSKTGYIPGSTAKTNQDNYFAHVNFANHPDCYLFGVCDGHGFYGGEVSSFIKQRLPIILSQDPDLFINTRKVISSSVHQCNSELSQIDLDTKFSGSTLIFVIIKGNTLFCANVGDSRALMARQIMDNTDKSISGKKWMAIALSRDHKPDDKLESERIYKSGGRVEAYQDENGNPAGPARVWLKNQDLPGLAMSRSLGDGVAASVGVICEPEILEIKMLPEDKFIVLGSDGVFEFITNEEIVKITVPYFKIEDCEGTCEAIVKEANKRWKSEEEVIDDITAVCVYLDVPK